MRREMLEHLGINPGDRIAVDLTEPGRAELHKPAQGSIEDVFGCLPNNGVRLSIEEINAVIEAGWSGRL